MPGHIGPLRKIEAQNLHFRARRELISSLIFYVSLSSASNGVRDHQKLGLSGVDHHASALRTRDHVPEEVLAIDGVLQLSPAGLRGSLEVQLIDGAVSKFSLDLDLDLDLNLFRAQNRLRYFAATQTNTSRCMTRYWQNVPIGRFRDNFGHNFSAPNGRLRIRDQNRLGQ